MPKFRDDRTEVDFEFELGELRLVVVAKGKPLRPEYYTGSTVESLEVWVFRDIDAFGRNDFMLASDLPPGVMAMVEDDAAERIYEEVYGNGDDCECA